MASVSQNTIDLIRDTADIVDVVSEFVPLQAAGKNMKGLCPFHSEKTPSFFVSKERQIFNCFGCGEKGNSITFVQKYKNMSFVEALHYLADKYNIEMELDNNYQQLKSNVNLYKVNEMALKYFTLNLLNIDTGKKALQYLLDRGLDIPTIEEFEIGYAPSGRNGLLDQLGKDFQPLEMLNVGLINKSMDNDYYDLFRDRIMFPIHDENKKLVAFSGRVFGNSDNQAKYVNTPYTELFSKGMLMYNLHRALPYIRTNNRMVLMEGYMDVIKANKFGIKETVCSMGTQLTIDQALLMKKFTDNVIICFDGDRAGREATYKALKLLEKAQLNIKIVLMPQGVDPDDYMTQHDDFKYYLENNQLDQYDFVYQMIIENKNLTKPAEIEMAKNKLFDFFASTSGMIREIYFQKFSSDTLVNYQTLVNDYQQYQIDNRIMENYKQIIKRQQVIKVAKPRYREAEKTIFNYYLKDISYRDTVNDRFNLLEFQDHDVRYLISTAKEKYSSLGQDESSAIIILKSDLTGKNKDKFEGLLLRKDYEYSLDDFESCIRVLEIAKLEQDIEELQAKAKLFSESNNSEEYFKYKTEILNKRNSILKLEGRKHEPKANN